MKKLICIAVVFLALTNLLGQEKQTTFEKIEGHWEGAFIKANAYQRFDVQFYKKDTAYFSLQIIEDWHPQFGEFELPVTIDSDGKITTNTGYGKAVLNLDEKNLEILGFIEGSVPSISINLKKVPEPPAPDYNTEEITIPNGDISLHGHLHSPISKNTNTAIILVGGRGCYAGSTKYDLYAKVLRKYGVSVLVFNKRGTGKSTGDCALATIDDLASDVIACKKFLENHPKNFDKIGVLGSSAGGWVMVKAEEDTDFDFMISVVGPATSVRDQQMQSLNYGIDFYKLSETARTQLTDYTNLLFDAKPNKTNFNRIQELLKSAETEDWRKLLDDTDVPSSIETMDELWVRRHNYNPGPQLSEFDKPFLGIYGEIDWIVPYKENIDRLKKLFTGDRNKLLKTVVAYQAEHGTEVKGKFTSLSEDKSYWRFFRISPQVLIEIVDFLKTHNLID
ncbi:MAG: prolyl oligopeptidase family serine peptidase [Flavobacteriaceae bacterium]|nr:prolyl oligopeptidase family serine peptidase [Flavobacteriaceae bacterium]